MQIDWVSAKTTTPPSLWPGYDPGAMLVTDENGEVVERRRRVREVKDDDPSSSRRFRVWTPDPGTLWLFGNPVKLLQDHNLFGSTDTMGLYLEAGVWVRRHLSLFPGASTWEVCQFSKPEFSRLDITRSARLPSEADVSAFIRETVGSAHSRHGAPDLGHEGTAYFGKHSRRWTLKVYAKRQELLAESKRLRRRVSRFLGNESGLDELLDWAQGVVRFELTLRGPEIQALPAGLDLSDRVTLRRIWEEYFGRLTFNENAAMSRQPDLIEKTLKPHLLLAVQSWRAGNDLRDVYSKASFYRLRRELLGLVGVDIASPPVVEPSGASRGLSGVEWEPEPIPGRLVEPRADLKRQYGLL